MKKFKFTISGNEYDVEIQKFEDNIARIEVNGTSYSVEVHKEVKQSKTPIFLRQEVPSPTRSETKIKKTIGATQIKSPLPGNILQVFVKVGDEVKKGDRLLIYEAMKMENAVLAEKDGMVSQVKVQKGESVLEGDVLIEIS
ncbi:MAG: biotin/lipoyl-binding protein [Bacteroidales bacterium]|nr:biotin/lipoyl-binding protein [Bacteroidales bacterium]